MAQIAGKQLRDSAISTAKLADGVLTADIPGRLKMADNFIVPAKLLMAEQTYDFSTATALKAPAPSVDADVATKYYVDTVASGLDPKSAVNAATTALLTGTPTYNPITNTVGRITFSSGPASIDGVTLSNGHRILVKNEDGGTKQISSVDTRADSSKDLQNDYFVIYAAPHRAFYVWYNVNAEGTDPEPTPPSGVSYVGVEVAIATNATAAAVATATKNALDALTTFQLTAPFGTITIAGGSNNEMTIPNAYGGLCPDVAEGVGTSFTFATDTPGTGLWAGANGIWVRTSANQWDRATDFDGSPAGEVHTGAWTSVQQGTSNHDKSYILTTHETITVGTITGSPMEFSIFSSIGLGGTPSTIQPDASAAEGSSSTAAKSDHVHAISTAAPGTTLDPTTTNAEGTGNDFARALHTHAIATAVAVVATGTANDAGNTNTYARGNHVHQQYFEQDTFQNVTASATTGDGDQATVTTISRTNPLGSLALLLVNGIAYRVANGDGERASSPCFVGASNAAAVTYANFNVGGANKLYWNGSIAGFQLAADDKLSLVYSS